jgi:ATP-binding cassette, subfamily B, bacterial
MTRQENQTQRMGPLIVPSALLALRRGLALVLGAAPATAAISIALMILLSALPILAVWLTKLIVDDAAALASGATVLTTKIMALAGLYVLTLMLPSSLQPIQWALDAWLQDRATAAVDHQLMSAGTCLVDLTRIERPEFQDELRLVREAAWRSPRLFLFLHNGLGPAIVLVGLAFLLARLHPLIPIVLAAASVPHVIGQGHINQLKYAAMERRSRAAREMDYCVRVVTEPATAKEVRVFGLDDFFLQRFRTRCAAALSEVSRVRIKELGLAAILSCVYAASLAGSFWYVATQAGADRFTLGDVALYLNAVIQLESRVYVLSYWFGFVYEILLYLRGLFGFLDRAEPGIALAPEGPGAPSALENGVALRQVGFSYPTSAVPVLDRIDTLLPAGKITALVGVNGAGKSTLVKLLTRMYDPDIGAIVLDGVALAVYNLSSLRGQIGTMYQDFAHFALTLRENIAVGAFAASQGAATVEQAARRAGADTIAAALPQGYDTPLTRRFEGGVELSGGEWQKVALARAFIRNAVLIILDEPTAALDAEAEEHMFARFRELAAGKTALLISHRFSTVRMADQILVIEGGRIVEAGSHAELIAREGRYAALYEMQAGRYRSD